MFVRRKNARFEEPIRLEEASLPATVSMYYQKRYNSILSDRLKILF